MLFLYSLFPPPPAAAGAAGSPQDNGRVMHPRLAAAAVAGAVDHLSHAVFSTRGESANITSPPPAHTPTRATQVRFVGIKAKDVIREVFFVRRLSRSASPRARNSHATDQRSSPLSSSSSSSPLEESEKERARHQGGKKKMEAADGEAKRR